MASRLQFQSTGTSSVTTAQQSPVEPEEQVAFEIPTVLLAQHQIERELLGARPRFVQNTVGLIPYLASLAYLPVLGFQFYNMYQRFPGKRGQLLWIFLSALGILGIITLLSRRGGLRTKSTKQELLRTGIPYRAVVEEISASQNFVNGSYGLTFWYQNSHGHLTRETTRIVSRSIDGRDIAPGDTFTLLVSATDPEDMLPYFMAYPFKVIPVEATSVSHDVSARIAKKASQVASLMVGHLGAIEPELQTGPGRNVHFISQEVRVVYWLTAMVALFASCSVIFWDRIFHDTLTTILFSSTALPLFISVQTAWDLNFKKYSLLRNGTATRAVMTKQEVTSVSKNFAPPDQVIQCSYEFEGANGLKRRGDLYIKRSRATQLGLVLGATFTVLYDPRRPTLCEPYFNIYGIEVVGKTPANITPP